MPLMCWSGCAIADTGEMKFIGLLGCIIMLWKVSAAVRRKKTLKEYISPYVTVLHSFKK